MQLSLLRAFLVACEAGSITAAAERLHLGQPSLTRQLAALEREVGARLLERTARGVVPTAAGQALAKALPLPLAQIDAALSDCRRFANGARAEIRVGYLQSLARRYLNPAVLALRAAHPGLRVKLNDLCAGGQMRALEAGEIDIALLGQEGRLLARRFYSRKIRSVGVAVALPDDHPAADRPALRLADLRGQPFIGKDPKESPGYNEWISGLCRKAGYRPRFVRQAETLADMFTLALGEGAVALVPEIVTDPGVPSVVLRPLADPAARWDLMVVWQRGRLAPAVKTFIDNLPRGQPKPVRTRLSA